jgi:TonB family protein
MSASRTFIGSVVCADLVGYSKRNTAQQQEIKQLFNKLLMQVLKRVPVDDRIILDTGDGAAISFLGDPEQCLAIGLKLRDTMNNAAERLGAVKDPDSGPVRIGINLGPVRLAVDMNGHPKIIGDGINVAEKICGFANPGQIIVSRPFHDMVSRISDKHREIFRYEGVRTDRNVRDHEIYSVKPLIEAAPAVPPPPVKAVQEEIEPTGPPRESALAELLRDRKKVDVAAAMLIGVIVVEGAVFAMRAGPSAPSVAQTKAPETKPLEVKPPEAKPVPAAKLPDPVKLPPPGVQEPVKLPVVQKKAPPVVETKTPEKKPTTPVIETKAPEKKSPLPVIETKAPEKKPSPPVIETKAPEKKPSPPVIETKAPEKKPSPPVIETKAPEKKVEEPPRVMPPAAEPAPVAREEPKPKPPTQPAPQPMAQPSLPVLQATPISRAPVNFPLAAVNRGISFGTVRARLTINAAGAVTDVNILSADPPQVFNRAATSSLENWKFNPGAEKRTYEIEIEFKR